MATFAGRRPALLAGPAVPSSNGFYGSLDGITDSGRRALRPIGATAREVATRTSGLLSELSAIPGVRIFQGVRSAAPGTPRIPHAVSAGRRLVLVESVAWPPGRYAASQAGQIHCDGVYIGQSVRALAAAVRHWREVLPPRHRITALVIVYPAAEGDLTLPGPTVADVAWVRAGEAVRDLRACFPRVPRAASMRAVAELVAAAAEEEKR